MACLRATERQLKEAFNGASLSSPAHRAVTEQRPGLARDDGTRRGQRAGSVTSWRCSTPASSDRDRTVASGRTSGTVTHAGHISSATSVASTAHLPDQSEIRSINNKAKLRVMGYDVTTATVCSVSSIALVARAPCAPHMICAAIGHVVRLTVRAEPLILHVQRGRYRAPWRKMSRLRVSDSGQRQLLGRWHGLDHVFRRSPAVHTIHHGTDE